MLIVGIVILAVGISDFVIAAMLARSHAASAGGLGDTQPSPAVRILRRSGAVTLVLGVVLVVVGLSG